jgi:protein tyrosine phosphatase (PTP) superfamily phosphohydrolase (DUF442 family)
MGKVCRAHDARPTWRRRERHMGFVALLVTTMCATSIAYDTTNSSAGLVPTERTIARKLAVEGVPNLGEVNPTLYHSAQPTRQGFQKLAEMGISIVVDLRVRGREIERQQVTNLGMRFVAIPWNCFHPEDTDIARFLRLLRDNRGKRVFVHCQTGDDRNDDRSVSNGRTRMDRRGSHEGDGSVRLHVLASSDLPRTIILRSEISKAIQDQSSLPRSASQRARSRTIAFDLIVQ